MFFHRVDELVFRRIHAQVVNHKARAAQHHDAQIFADIVQIALDRAHDHRADGVDARRGQNGFDMRHPGFHRARTRQHLGHKNKILPKLDPHDAHARDQAVVHNLQRAHAVVQCFSRQMIHIEMRAVDQCGGNGLHFDARPRERGDIALNLIRAFQKLLDLLADKRILNIAQLSHGRSPRANLRPLWGFLSNFR